MEKKDGGRWFLIEHKACGSVLTVNSQKFLETVNNDHFDDKGLGCPTCLTAFNQKNSLREFFEKYELLIKTLDQDGFKIREIKTSIDFEDSKEKQS